MRQNEIDDNNISRLVPQQYENIFNVYVDGDGYYFYNLLKTVNFPEDLREDIFSLYTVQDRDTWTGISWKVYNDIRMWWIICAANNITNPLEMPESGTQLKILNIYVVKNILNQLKEE